MQNHLPNKINQTKIISLHRHLRRSAGKRAKKATTEIHQYRFIHICLIHLYTQATSVIPSENQTWFSSEISQLAMYDCWLVTSHMIPYYPPLFHSLRWISDFRLKRCSLPWDLFLDFTHDLPFLRNFHGFPQVLPMISPQKKSCHGASNTGDGLPVFPVTAKAWQTVQLTIEWWLSLIFHNPYSKLR